MEKILRIKVHEFTLISHQAVVPLYTCHTVQNLNSISQKFFGIFWFFIDVQVILFVTSVFVSSRVFANLKDMKFM